MKKALHPIQPPAAIETEYRRKLQKAVREMEKSIVYWLKARYRANEDKIMDSATDDLLKELRKLTRQWNRNFNELAKTLPKSFISKVRGYESRNLVQQMKPYRDAGLGFNLDFKYISNKERQVFNALVAENVNLIKSIAKESLTQVEGITMRAIQNGHDLSTLTEDLHEQFGISERRAATIARDQTAKATNGLSRQRLMDYGVKKARWMHTSAGKTYRDSHVDMDGEEYDIEQGCFDPDYGGYIQPGELVNCRCLAIPIIPEVEAEEEEPPTTEEPETQATEAEQETENFVNENEGISPEGEELIQQLKSTKVEYKAVEPLESKLSTDEIVERIGGGDLTGGSCSSTAFCYAGNEAGLNVRDFRGGNSRLFFREPANIKKIAKLPNVVSWIEKGPNDFTCAGRLLDKTVVGKKYYFTAAKHAAIVRRTADGFEYLELQSAKKNGWNKLDFTALKRRFSCRKSHTALRGKIKLENETYLIDIESLGKSEDFKRILGYLNTAETKQLKGVKGYAK